MRYPSSTKSIGCTVLFFVLVPGIEAHVPPWLSPPLAWFGLHIHHFKEPKIASVWKHNYLLLVLPFVTWWYGADCSSVGMRPTGWERHNQRSPNAQWKQKLKLHNTQTTDRFVSRFTLHRGYRTINLDNVTYKM